MSLDGFRVPLLEQRVEINTPMVKNGTQKITTPPESVLAMRKKSLTMETPIKTFDPSQSHHRKNGLLLSPAFSSPQNLFKQSFNSSHMTQDFNSSPPNLQALSSFDDEFDDEKPKKKKKKEKKAFDILSSDKPPYSYATLIGMSILSHPDKRLTLSSIYQWIADTFKYYKREDVGWQNSIRHNLSLNKAFIKGEKSKDGKGHFWCIEPGSEDQFLKLRNNKKSSYDEIMDQISSRGHNPPVQESKRSINSIPSSPNYYESNDSINTFNRFENINTAVGYHKRARDQTDQAEEADEAEQTLDDDLEYNKRQKLNNKEANLGAPFNQSWNLTPRPFQANEPKQNHQASSSGSSLNTSNFDLMSTPKLVISESPNKPLLAGKNLTFTSSFSCNSNLELSPIRPNETGPLLEPLTPGRIYKAGAINHHLSTINYQNLNQNNLTQLSANLHANSNAQSQFNSTSFEDTNSQPPKPKTHSRTHSRSLSNHLPLPNPAQTLQPPTKYPQHLRTPKSSGNNGKNTPMRVLKTPQNTSAKKMWNSPGYLDDFYYSPLITSQSALHSYDDDDMILRAFESPGHTRQRNGYTQHLHPPLPVHRRS